MAFVDELTIDASAGKGGDGVVRWLHLKGKEYSGPSGGNGGDGGDVYVRAVRDLSLLGHYRGEKKFHAGPGADGAGRSKEGKRGKDLTIDLPVGSVVTNERTGEVYDLTEDGQTIMVLKGGRGGAGNEVFKSSVNRTPTEATPGAAGEAATLRIELRLIADAGLIGLPNAGKTSLLNVLTGAKAKVGNYAFTTLDPNLGVIPGGFVLADIPGLIEGASAGKGLGYKFLRHIARTRLLVHCISLESPDPFVEYQTVRKELEAYSPELVAKPEIIVFTKSDLRTPQELRELMTHVAGKGEFYTASIIDDASVKALRDMLTQRLSK